MKYLGFLLILIFNCLIVFGQRKKEKIIVIPFDSLTQKFTYSNVVPIENTSAETLYKRSKKWSVQKFSDEKFLVDELNSSLTDQGNFPINVVVEGGMYKIPVSFTVLYTISTQFKDGRFKYIISNFKLSGNSNGTTTEQPLEVFAKSDENAGIAKNAQKKYIEKVCTEIDLKIKKDIASLENVMKGISPATNDW